MNTQANVPALPRSVWDILDEYDAKAAQLGTALQTFTDATTALEAAACVSGTYAGSIWQDARYSSTPRPQEKTLRAALLKSAWKACYTHLRIDRIAPANDRRAFDLAMENPPEFTEGNILATFGDYVGNQRHHLLRGLAEAFCDLDPAYKSHSKVKIGVEGLPKRIILSNVGSWGSWGYDRLRDTLTALALYRGRPHPEHRELADLIKDANAHGASYWHGIEIRTFQNGNAHLHFDPETLREINLALAEFYGDTLPDSPEEAAKKRTGTAVSKDLAYYPTPRAVVDRVLNSFVVRGDSPTFLEPSCGDGRIMDAIADKWPRARITGVEYHAGRADQARAKGHHVHRANFLETATKSKFDYVVMNPPFAGQHWKKHLRHALNMLAPGGVLACILPASAMYDGHLAEFGVKGTRGTAWTDLPVASFSESGTNIPTGFVTLSAT